MSVSNLVDLLRFRSEKTPEKIAYVYLKDGEEEAERFSYLSLYKRVLHLAGKIQNITQPGDRVLLIYNPGLDYVVAFFACLFAGVVAIPVYPPRKNRSLERLDSIINDAKANLVLTTSNIASNFQKHQDEESKLLTLNRITSDLEADDRWQDYKEFSISENSIAYLQYTSGSTGTPKGVMVTHKNIIYNLQDLDATYEHSEDSVMVTWLPIFHDLGLIYGLLQPLYNGFPCYLMAPASFIQRPLRWLEAISKYKATHSPAPNFAYALCCKNTTTDQIKDLDLSSWEIAMIGTEPVRVETIREFSEKYQPYGFRPEAFTPAYGLAESTLKVSTIHKSKPVVFLSVSSAALENNIVVEMSDGEQGSQYFAGHGSYVLDTKIIIVDPETMKLTKPGHIGEIWIGGTTCALGYWEREKETEEVFKAFLKDSGEGPFLRTGDLGFYHKGELFIAGRLKDLIIIRGLNHYPQDIEVSAEKSHPALKQDGGAAFSVEVNGKEQLVIVQEVNRGHLSTLDPEEIFTAIRKQVSLNHDLQVYAISLLMPASLPKTSSGKIQRRTCKKAFTDCTLTTVAEWINNTDLMDPVTEPVTVSKEKHFDSKIIEGWITGLIAKEMNLRPETIQVSDTFEMLGMDSLFAAEMTGALGNLLSRKLEATLVYNYPTIRALASYLSAGQESVSLTGQKDKPAQTDSHIAIVGMGCRFPKADNPAAFWDLLKHNESAIRKLPEGRWRETDLENITDDKTILNTITWGGFLDDPAVFEPSFFGIAPREAVAMDPQQRLLLEVAWEALEDAGISPSDLPEYKTGVYIGISNNDYQRIQSNSASRFDQYAGTGNAASIAANRLSYFLNLKGPSMSIDTACSSSLVSIHQACQSLRTGEVDAAITGGVNLILNPDLSVVFAKAGMLAPDGRCKTFDAAADGYVRGEGCGIIVLKRLEDAIADGDRIQAVIRGTAINQDGRSNGITAPNGLSQVRIIRQALANADISPAQVSYIEAHGTGTSLGDPIEVNSFSAVLLEGRTDENPCMVGSVKTHIGHLESAAGIAGVIKLVLALRNKEIPPHINFKKINPLIEWKDNRMQIAGKHTAWDFSAGKRIAAISSFGFGGTNAHAILEEAPENNDPLPIPTSFLLPLSGRDGEGLRLTAERYAAYLKDDTDNSLLGDICYTAGIGRSHFGSRLSITGKDSKQLKEQLVSWLSGKSPKGVHVGEAPVNRQPKVAWLFTGQGAQYAGMGKSLYEQEPVFRAALDRCNELFSSYQDQSLLDVLFNKDLLIHDTTYAQAALFSLEWSLVQLWQHWGLMPDVVLGHSVGEYAAACIAGVFSLEDGMQLIVSRGRLMGALPREGGMMNVFTGQESVLPLLSAYQGLLSVAAINSPSQTVISGETAALDRLEAQLAAEGIKTIRLEVSHAFHSRLMQPMVQQFREVAEKITYHTPQLPLISLVSGNLAGGEVADAAYWTDHILATVNFMGGMEMLGKQDIDICLEIGPKPVLMPLGMQCLDQAAQQPLWLYSLRREGDGEEQLTQSLAALYAAGCTVNWANYWGRRRKVQLPTYPFQRSRYWIETADTDIKTIRPAAANNLLEQLGAADITELTALLSKELQLENTEAGLLPKVVAGLIDRYRQATGNKELNGLLYRTVWNPLPLSPGEGLNGTPGSWLLFMDDAGRMKALSAALIARGAKVKEVEAAEAAVNYQDIVHAAIDSGITGIIYGKALDLDNEANPQNELDQLLQLIKALGASNIATRLWVLTNGAQAIKDNEQTIPAQAAINGMIAVMGNEMPQHQPVLLDYTGDITAIIPELGGKLIADRIAYRDGKRYAARLESIVPQKNKTTKTFKAALSGCYLISGGTGALGIAAARWLAEKGAGEVILLSRSGGNKNIYNEITALTEKTGTLIRIAHGDTGNRSDMERIFKEITAGQRELKGIIHAAGIVADGLLVNQDSARLEQVMHPKAAGGWLLHELSEGKKLDFFICYSSAAAVLGFAGQGNYAAANSYLEGLGHYRRALGLPATVISWGPWKQGGMAAALGSTDQARMQRMGISYLETNTAFTALEYILTSNEPSAGIFNIDWEQYGKETAQAKYFLSGLVKQQKDDRTVIKKELEKAIPQARAELLAVYLENVLGSILGMENGKLTERETGFSALGMDSLMAMELRKQLERELQVNLPPTIAFNYPRINALKDHLLEVLGYKQETAAIIPTTERISDDREPVAIIGMGCRFPGGANSPEAFWELLRDGVDAITEVPAQRWDVEQYYHPDPDEPGKIYTRRGGFIDNVDLFDAKFFGIAPNEADYIDPQQRLLLEVSWEALENAGIAAESLNTTPTGVFVGIGQNDYGQYHLENARTSDINTYTGTGNSYSFAAGRISYFLGAQGPSISIDTACSSSLVTVSMACQSLRNGESDLALAGGVQLMLTPQSSIFLSKSKTLSPDGKCKTFSDEANGYVRGEGCGMVVLKRLSDAIRDNDRILSVVRGAAINHDGRSSGLTVPNGQSQETLIKKAVEIAGITPDEISYVESHGTGTSLGDPIEMEAIGHSLAINRTSNDPLLVGSVKTNIGHLEQAAGIASLIKVTLAMNHKQIPAHLNFVKPSRHINWTEIAVNIPVSLTEWSPKNGKRIASVSSFGLSGTNAHIILEEPAVQPVKDSLTERPVHLLTLSAKNTQALNDLAGSYLHLLQNSSTVSFPDICHSVNTGRSRMAQRLAFSAENKTDAIAKLKSFTEGNAAKGMAAGRYADHTNHTVAFLFSGQGSQYPGMGKELFDTHPGFRETLLQCEAVFKNYLDRPLLEILFPAEGDKDLIQQTKYAQPALFAIEYAMANLWLSWSIRPAYLMGHSLGELTAACIAGVFSLEDGLKLVAKRAALMQNVPATGGMMSVLTSVERAARIVDHYKNELVIAAFNGPEHFVLSGNIQSLKAAEAEFNEAGIPNIMLNVSHAFHSPNMRVIQDEFRKVVRTVQFHEPQIPLISNITGKIGGQEIITPDYWVAQITSPVYFLQGINELESKNCALFLEIGPDASLLTMAKSCLASPEKIKLMSSMRYKTPVWKLITDNLAELFVAGYQLNLKEFDLPYNRKKVALPTYPFQRRKHWNGPSPDMLFQNGNNTILRPQTFISRDTAPGAKMSEMKITEKQTKPDRDAVVNVLLEMVNKFSGLEATEEDLTISFMELGLDSLILVKMIDAIKDKFGIKLSLKQFFEDLSSINALANHIDETNIRVETAPEIILSPSQPAEPSVNENNNLGEAIFKKLEELSKRIESLENLPAKVLKKPDAVILPGKPSGKLNFKAVKLKEDVPFTAAQAGFIASFITRYNKRTASSKTYAQEHRHVLADWINSIDFRLSLKEFLYPIVSEWSSGSRFRDIDGNNYVDIGLGYGVNFFGNSPAFVTEAIRTQLLEGMELATQSDLAGEVAQLIHELTGVERVVFSNTGTEAIMAAMRIARTKTGKKKIAIFTGSYHGTFDGVLAQMESEGEHYFSTPIGPGIPQGYADDLLVLTLGADESIKIIEKHAHELAAVMVEPVQSRRPGFQPVEFLRKLRVVTQNHDIALIFDEIITGFRIHPGGAQAHFGIYADIVTYGKIPGGGMPIGIIAGKKEYIDTIDGGWWQYGDDSYPSVEMTFFGGTFCKHPLTMAAAKASLLKMKREGPALQERVNQLTQYFASILNDFFADVLVPIKIVHFGSLFRFESFGKYSLVFQPVEMSLLFYLMMEKGIYTWERRICFFSTEHSYEDADIVIDAVKRSVHELLENGFFAEREIMAVPEKGIAITSKSFSFPLTDAQKQLWLLAELEDNGSQVYNVSATLHFSGPLNRMFLQKALDNTVQRHEGLRTVITADGENQVVLPELSYTIPYATAQRVNNEDKQQYTDEWILEGSRAKFELTDGPLFRIRVLQLAGDEFLLQFTAHHIVIDGWSFGVVLFDISNYYNALISGRQTELPAALSFKEYAGLLKQALYGPEMETAGAYWNNKLIGKQTPLQLPADFPQPASKSYQAARCTRKFSPSFHTKIKDFSRQHNSTPFMLMLSAYAAFLHRYCTADELIIGVPVSGRNFENDKNVVGYCANLLPFVSQYNSTNDFTAFLSSSKKELIECFENQAYPFANILDNFKQKNSVQSPLVNVTFNLNPVNELPMFDSLKVDWVQTPLSFAPFDLFFDITVLPNGMVLDCDYNADLFLPKTVFSLLENFEAFLNGLLTHPETPVGLLPLLSSHSEKVILEDWNDTGSDFPSGQTVISLIDKQIIDNKFNTSIIIGSKSVSYNKLYEVSLQVSSYLVNNGIKPGEPVGIYMQRSANWITAILGILKAGGVYVPLDVNLPDTRLQFIIEDAGIKWTLTDNNSTEKAIASGLKILNLDEPVTAAKADFPEQDPERNCYIIYTSGSTGQPKGCAITHRNLMNYLSWASGYYFTPGKPVNSALFTSLSFDFTATPIFCCLISGGQIEVYPEEMETPDVINACFKEGKQYDFLKLTPAYLGLLDNIPSNSGNIDKVILGGEVVLPAHVAALKRILPSAKIYNEYGPTEATIGCIVKELHADDEKILIGRPIQNMRVYITDKNDQLLPAGVPGEICLAGESVSKGYLNRDELTRQKFVDDPFNPGEKLYKTGDLGRWTDTGEIEYLGRVDEQVKIRGFRVEPGECTAVLSSHKNVKEAVVTAMPSTKGTENELIAWFVPKKSETVPSVAELHNFMALKLPLYMVPVRFIQIEQIPLTLNGKADKSRLPLHEDQEQVQADFIAPFTHIEKLVARIWSDVLGVHNPGLADNFFAAGGHSLKAAKMVAAILKKTGVKIPLKTIFNTKTLGELAGLIEHAEAEGYEPIPHLPAADSYQLSHPQKRIWIANQLSENPGIFNMTGFYEVTGKLDVAAFEKSLSLITERHAILRTVFTSFTAEPRQRVLKPGKDGFKMNFIDLSGTTDAAERSIELLHNESIQPFDLEKGPLLRATLCHVAENDFLFAITFHHILLDGWSTGLFIEEFSENYAALTSGKLINREPLKVQYHDFAAWHNKLITSGQTEISKAYWKQQLSGIPARLNLPLDRPRQNYLTYDGKQLSIIIEPELYSRLALIAQQHGVTLYIIVLSAIYVTLSPYAGGNDVLLGVETAERRHPDLQKMLGFFLNTIVLRAGIRKDDTLAKVISEVNKVVNEGLAHQDYPFDVLLHELKTPREQNRTPLFDVQVDYVPHLYDHNYDDGLVTGLELKMKYLPVEVKITQYDISFLITDKADFLKVDVIYNSHLFNEATIAAIAGNYKTVLTAIATDETAKVDDLLPEEKKTGSSKKVSLKLNF